MSQTSFTLKQINVSITLGQGQFGGTGSNTVKLSGLRVVATINKAGFPSMDSANVRVYGVDPAIMNQVSTLGIPLAMVRTNNYVSIEAGDDTNGFSIVFVGYLHQCWQDYSEVPEVSLQINAWGGASQALTPVAPSSFPGTADVATVMSGLANQMGLSFESNGVSVKLNSPYFPGTALEQAHAVAREANIEMYVDSETGGTVTPMGTLAIWPKTGTRGGAIPLISAASGLVGYPTFESNGMSFTTLFNPSIKLGGQVQMQSTVGAAAQTVSGSQAVPGAPAGTQSGGPNGLWYVVAPLTHSLSAQLPGGPWFTQVHCVRVPGTPGTP